MASIEIDGVNGVIKSTVSDSDLTIKGNDGGSEVSALAFDMSDAAVLQRSLPEKVLNEIELFLNEIKLDIDTAKNE